MATKSKKDDADSQFRKVQRAEDGKKAMSEYEAEAAAVRAKTARLKALRLARDAAVQAAPPPPPAPAKKTGKKDKSKAASLSEFLKGQQGGGRNS